MFIELSVDAGTLLNGLMRWTSDRSVQFRAQASIFGHWGRFTLTGPLYTSLAPNIWPKGKHFIVSFYFLFQLSQLRNTLAKDVKELKEHIEGITTQIKSVSTWATLPGVCSKLPLTLSMKTWTFFINDMRLYAFCFMYDFAGIGSELEASGNF